MKTFGTDLVLVAGVGELFLLITTYFACSYTFRKLLASSLVALVARYILIYNFCWNGIHVLLLYYIAIPLSQKQSKDIFLLLASVFVVGKSFAIQTNLF